MPRQRKLPSGMWKRGDTYYARFRSGGRLVRKRLSGDFDAAREVLNDLKARADRADFDLIDNDYSWDDLKAEVMRDKKQMIRGAKGFKADLEKFEKYCKIRSVKQITHQYIVGFRDHRLAEGVCARTVNKQVNSLRSCLNKAVEWGRIGSNPIKGIKPLPHDKLLKKRRALSAAEFQAIFDHSPAHLRPVWRMFGSTGLRLMELVTLTFNDVDWDGRSITIRAENSKNKKPREIPLDDEMLATIDELYQHADQRRPMPGPTAKITQQQAENFSTAHVFVTKATTPWRNNLLRKFYAICKRAGIIDAVPGGAVDIHSLRVSFTTLAIDGGAKPQAVQAILGHSTLALTMGVYAKATDRSKRDAIGALPFAKVTAPEHVISIGKAVSA